MARVLLVEPYFSGSHRAWAEGLRDSSTHDVELLTLPGRFWKWRMFGGALTLATKAVEWAAVDGPPDTVIVSDMTDLPAFLGHAGAPLGRPKTILYMHENQLTYPLSPTARDDLAYAYVNWSSMVRADEIWFNSQFHLDLLFDRLPGFLSHFPDHRHSHLVEAVMAKSKVIPVGVDLDWVVPTEKQSPPLIIWNQRWEYDKDPNRLFQALYRLAENGHHYRLALCGENFRNVPDEFEAAKEHLSGHVVHYGYAPRQDYRTLLLEAAVVISTAKHEFFGIGAVEAMATGALPVFPNALSYRELLPSHLHELTLYDDDHELDRKLTSAVLKQTERDQVRDELAAAMSRFSWRALAPVYDAGLA